ncbi:MAG: pyruvate kinase, partial [Candidatus Handelsmanbacteria bacterium RIFCSPLOWO2_12_FULL_64_10]
MDVARLNFSHGTQGEHAKAVRLVREAARRAGRPVGILQDLQGPKMRVGPVAAGAVELRAGASFTLTTQAVPGDASCVSTTYKDLARDVKPEDRILLNDGLIELRVAQVEGEAVRCQVVCGGPLSSHKGINLPGVRVSAPALTEKDREDLRFGLAQGVDYVALSFVRRAEDVEEAKRVIREAGADAPVIAKLERPEAIDDLGRVLETADGVMVARGDLGVELSPERVPVLQKQIIEEANRAKSPVITATQMLESMTASPRPTRAEASDVANAIFDGTDAVMLSGETAVGRYPVEAAEMMARIVDEAERSLLSRPAFIRRRAGERTLTFPEATAEAACLAAQDLGARAIVAFTQSGATARLISKYRPRCPVIGFTPPGRVVGRMTLYWGVLPRTLGRVVGTDEMIARVDEALLREGAVSRGDTL